MPLSWLPRFLASPPPVLTIAWNRAAKSARPCPGSRPPRSERSPPIARMHEQQSGEQAEGPSLDGAVGGQRKQYARPSKQGLGGAPTGFGKTRSERARAGAATVNAVRRWPVPPTIAAASCFRAPIAAVHISIRP